ncbi:MAG: zinc-ribbon domain-containing protein [Bacteroidaceae bacterium]|nr:zinc-ribbon domain-containing protein [Bacteroidaceae bacterium]
MYCKHCGAKLDDDAKFCTECGKTVGEGVAVSSRPKSAAPVKAKKKSIPGFSTIINGVLLIAIFGTLAWILLAPTNKNNQSVAVKKKTNPMEVTMEDLRSYKSDFAKECLDLLEHPEKMEQEQNSSPGFRGTDMGPLITIEAY